MNFTKKHLLKIVLIPLFVTFVATSWVRFVMLEDFIVGYQVECTNSNLSCFSGCEDDICTDKYLYYYVEKHASDLRRDCGKSIENCLAARSCLPDDKFCEIKECSPSESDNCTLVSDEVETLMKNPI